LRAHRLGDFALKIVYFDQAVGIRLWRVFVKTLHSLTLDHSGEFAGHTAVAAALGRPDSVFFARPHRACDKGSVEQLNGLIRPRYPKRSHFRTVPQVDLDALRNHLNGCPMHVTGGHAPINFLDQLRKSS
jgi:IS30 family transposase